VPEKTNDLGRASRYVTDVPYTRHFAHQLAPATLRMVAAMNGVAAPADEDFAYCEIGSGVGDSLVLLAAANPRGRFVGIDVSAAHVATSRALAEEAGLTNVRFVERDFATLEEGELEPFDFIGAHGFLSWVGPTMRAALIDFAKARLKPRGLLYVSYNALPGWAAIEPLRRLILERGDAAGGSTLDRAREGVRFARRLADAGAGYFASHPTARSMLGLIDEAGLAYAVHEYMNAHWEPMYFADVARAMDAAELHFVGQMPLHMNVADLAIPPGVKDVAKAAGDRVAFETLKDYAVNEMFRSDVYVRGDAAGVEAAMRDFFQKTRFGTTVPLAQLRRSVKLAPYTLDFSGPLYDGVLGAITAGGASAVELAALPALASAGAKRVGDALMNLSLGGEVVPVRPAAPPSANAARYRVPLAFNRAVLEGAEADRPRVLASPVTGSGIAVSVLEALYLALLTSVEPEKHASAIRAFAHRAKGPVVVSGRPVADPAELVRVVQRELETYRARTAPKLAELGVLEAV
jgi:SAM-dependent methyltransferase